MGYWEQFTKRSVISNSNQSELYFEEPDIERFLERFVFQYITYKLEPRSYNNRRIPVLFVMTSNCAEEIYSRIGYDIVLEKYKNTLNGIIGPTKVMISGDTLQVNDYDKYNWTMFDPQAKKARREEVFPKELGQAFLLGADMLKNPWE